MGACRLARLAIFIGTPFVRLLCFVVAVSASVSCKVSPRLSVGVYYAGMSADCCRLLSLQTFQIPFPVRFVWLGRMVVACSPLPSATCFSVSGRYPVYWCNVSGLVSAIAMAVAICLPFLAGGGSLCAAQTLQVIRSGVCALFPFDNAKLQRVLYIYQTKIRFSAQNKDLYIPIKTY